MKIIEIKFVVVLILLFLGSGLQSIQGSHLMGSDFEYACLGNGKYKITVKVYRDCNGIPISQSNVLARSSNNETISISNQTKISVRDITYLNGCTSSSRCSGSGTYGLEQHIWTMTVDLDSFSTCEWTLSWEQAARNNSISTGQSAQNFYTTATLNKCLSSCNSSPVFSKEPTPIAFICHNQDFIFNNEVIDSVDNDSISYALVAALQGANNPTTYSGNFTPFRPMTFFGFPNQNLQWPAGFHFDEVTGEIAFRPIQLNQVAVIVIEVSEWRKVNGTMQVIGKTRRDMQVIVVNCPNNKPPNIHPPYAVKTCVGREVCMTIRTDDENAGDSVYISLIGGIPGANFTNTNGQDTVAQGTICWTPQPGDESSDPYSFKIEARDNKCPFASKTVRAFSIFVQHQDSVLDAKLDVAAGRCGFVKFNHFPAGNYGNYSSRYTVYNANDSVIWTSVNAVDSTYFSPGKYKVYLGLGGFDYCDTTIVDSFEVVPENIVTHKNVKVCEGEELLFLPDSTLAQGQSYIWYQETSPGTWVWTGDYPYKKFKPTHGGGYSAFLEYEACTITDTFWISYSLNPAASIATDHDSVCMDDALIQFASIDSLSPSRIVRHFWSFGDGSFDSVAPVSHTYNTMDSFQVHLLVRSDSGCWDTTQNTVWVMPGLSMDSAQDQWTIAGNSASFSIGQSQVLAAYQWQIDSGQGFIDLANAGRFSGANTTTLQFSNVQLDDSTFRFRCRVDLLNCSDISNEAGLHVTKNTGIGSLIEGSVFLYPNPASTTLYIRIESIKAPLSFQIVNSAGQAIQSGTLFNQEEQFDIKSLAPGVYLFHIPGLNGGLRFVKE